MLRCARGPSEGAIKTPMTWADLTIGAECGGSDGTSGLAGNPVVGRAFDRLVERGGTAIFEETVEMIGLRDLMVSRAASPAAAAATGRDLRQSAELLQGSAAVLGCSGKLCRRAYDH